MRTIRRGNARVATEAAWASELDSSRACPWALRNKWLPLSVIFLQSCRGPLPAMNCVVCMFMFHVLPEQTEHLQRYELAAKMD